MKVACPMDERPIPTCDFVLLLHSLIRHSVTYDASFETAKSSLTMEGIISIAGYDNRFESKECQLTLHDAGGVASIPDIDPDGVLGAVCGVMRIRKDVVGDAELFLPPVQLRVSVQEPAYRSIERLILSCMDAGRAVSAHVSFTSTDFIAEGASPLDNILGVSVSDVVTDRDRDFAIKSLEVSKSRQNRIDPQSRRPRSVHRNLHDPSFMISAFVRSVRFQRTTSGYVSRLTCEGTVRNFGAPAVLKDVECICDFTEYDKDDSGDYPKKAHRGRFTFLPAEESSISSSLVSLELYYVNADLKEFFLPMFQASESELVVVDCYVLLDPDELTKGGRVFAAISDYVLDITRVNPPKNEKRGFFG